MRVKRQHYLQQDAVSGMLAIMLPFCLTGLTSPPQNMKDLYVLYASPKVKDPLIRSTRLVSYFETVLVVLASRLYALF